MFKLKGVKHGLRMQQSICIGPGHAIKEGFTAHNYGLELISKK